MAAYANSMCFGRFLILVETLVLGFEAGAAFRVDVLGVVGGRLGID